MNHFKGKDPLSHLKEARLKGKIAASELHGVEMPGHLNACADAAKEGAFLLLLLWTLFGGNPSHFFMLIFLIALGIWKVGRSAILGWARLDRLHRLIEEERYEIEHHRPQEKEELKALYRAKGFSGKLLDEAVEVLMADDNRLLQVMLEEELGLNLESEEHPLKQAAGALVGVFCSGLIVSVGIFWLPLWGTPVCAFLVVIVAAALVAKFEKGQVLPSVIWNLATMGLSTGAAYFLAKVLL